jgi:hypothetical protein
MIFFPEKSTEETAWKAAYKFNAGMLSTLMTLGNISHLALISQWFNCKFINNEI